MSSFNTPYTASQNQPYPMGQAAGFQPGQQPLSTTQGGHVQLSPLESARLRLGVGFGPLFFMKDHRGVENRKYCRKNDFFKEVIEGEKDDQKAFEIEAYHNS